MNYTQVNTSGLECSYQYMRPIAWMNFIHISYSHIISDVSESYKISKYSLSHLQNQLVLIISPKLPVSNLQWTVSSRYEDRFDSDKRYLMDSRLSYYLRDINYYLDINNIFNRTHWDFESVPLPGRWIKAGISFTYQE